MTARVKDFIELWIERNVLSRAADEDQAERLALKLANDLAVEGLTFEELDINGDAQSYIRDIIVHVGEPGTPGAERQSPPIVSALAAMKATVEPLRNPQPLLCSGRHYCEYHLSAPL